MAKKTMVKKEIKVESPLEILQKKVANQTAQIADLEASLDSLRSSIDQIIYAFKRKFPYG